MLIMPLWAKTFLAREPYLFDPATAYNYGKFIGARYRNKPVLWMLGGDRPGRGVEEVTRAMARGLADSDGGRKWRRTIRPEDRVRPCGSTTRPGWISTRFNPVTPLRTGIMS